MTPDLLDCTLRDGSYVNRFQFTAEDTARICRGLETAGVRWIEVGHGLGLGASRRGGAFAAAASDTEYLRAAAGALKTARYGMFCIPGIATLDDLDRANDHGLQFVRIGTNITEVAASAPFVARAKQHGMFVCTNYMKSYVVPPGEFATQAARSRDYGADLIYLVDSAGGMLPHEIDAYLDAVQSRGPLALGFHGHNNLGLAAANSLHCALRGVQMIDTCLQGLGRSAGNAATEQVTALLLRAGFAVDLDLYALMDLGYTEVRPLLPESGINPIDLIAGVAQFHSSYMPIIRELSQQYRIDPRHLIVAVCREDQVNAPRALVERLARALAQHETLNETDRYRMDRFFVNEQQ